MAYHDILVLHLPVPQTRQFVVYLPSLFILDRSADCVVGAGEIALGLEFDIRNQIVIWASDVAMISEFIFHLPEKNTTGVHIGLCQDTGDSQHQKKREER